MFPRRLDKVYLAPLTQFEPIIRSRDHIRSGQHRPEQPRWELAITQLQGNRKCKCIVKEKP